MRGLFRVLPVLALTLVLAFGSGGCAMLQKLEQNVATVAPIIGDVAPRVAIAAIATYDSFVVAATGYQNLRRCTGSNGPLCRDPALRTKIDAAVYSGRRARNDLKAFMRAHPGDPTPRVIYDYLIAANDTLAASTAAYRAASGQ